MPAIQLPNPPQRILLIKPSALGDVVHALPILHLLRTTWPAAHISWLVMPPFAGILDGHPQLDKVILFQRRAIARGWHTTEGPSLLFSLSRELHEGNFDLVIDLQGLFRSGWLAARTRAPVRIGFSNAREFAPLFYTHRVDPGHPEQHALERYLTLAESLGCGRAPVKYIFPTDDVDRAAVRAMLPPNQPFALLFPGTNWQTKRWPAERFAELIQPLQERHGLVSVLAGGTDAAELAHKIPGAINLAGRTNLRQLVALIEASSLVVANDSGPMHIAAALGRPLVTLFGPTNPVRTGPHARLNSVVRLDIVCSPCYSRRCSHQSCLQWLMPESVLNVASDQLNLHNNPPHASGETCA